MNKKEQTYPQNGEFATVTDFDILLIVTTKTILLQIIKVFNEKKKGSSEA